MLNCKFIKITLENTGALDVQFGELMEGKDNTSRFIKVINKDASSLANRNLFLHGHQYFFYYCISVPMYSPRLMRIQITMCFVCKSALHVLLENINITIMHNIIIWLILTKNINIYCINTTLTDPI